MKQHDISQLIEVSRRYGSDERYVLLGGGNTSYKTDDVMYVKASGHALSNIDADGFVAMSMTRLMAIWDKSYAEDKEEREKAVLIDMMAARNDGETARPSVEALLHGIIPFRYVVHMHPAMVNGLTSSRSGEEAVHTMFPSAIWIPLVNPGYILAKTVREAQMLYAQSHTRPVAVIFLQNHGVFVGADTVEEINQLYEEIMGTLDRYIIRKPIFTSQKIDKARVALVQEAMATFYTVTEVPTVLKNLALANRITDKEAFYPISSAYTPDHIVYSGFAPLWIEESVFETPDTVSALLAEMEEFKLTNGVPAKIIVVQNTAAFATSEAAMTLFIDTIKVAAFTESFGGPRFMDDDQIDFIRNWEVESYRARMNT